MNTDDPVKIYTMPQLAANPELLRKVVHMINTAYLMHSSHEAGLRYEADMDMIENCGEQGTCAFITLNSNIIATASLRLWGPEQGGPVDTALKNERPTDHELLGAGLSWEIKAVATLDSPETRGKGLVSQCLAALRNDLIERHPNAKSQGFLLWVSLSEDQTGKYWRRRGFELVGPSELKPKGFWGAYEEFWYSTLVRRFEGGE